MKEIIGDLPLVDLAAVVCHACSEKGIEVVLSGGACVSIFTKNKYASCDLDFVLRSPTNPGSVQAVMESLGFSRDGRHYRHPRTLYIVEFLSPPLSVGGEPVREIQRMRRGDRTLRLLSPTECVKDRLAAYYHWNDRPSLNQAVMVCLDKKIDFPEVQRWSAVEGMADKYGRFRKALATARKLGK